MGHLLQGAPRGTPWTAIALAIHGVLLTGVKTAVEIRSASIGE
jgi:hypothetical protein